MRALCGSRGYAAPRGWRICVSDNGNGFTKEKLGEVYAQFAYCDSCLADNQKDILKTKIDNMALGNIYIRWKIMKGGSFALHIQNLAPRGCAVELAVANEGGDGVC